MSDCDPFITDYEPILCFPGYDPISVFAGYEPKAKSYDKIFEDTIA